MALNRQAKIYPLSSFQLVHTCSVVGRDLPSIRPPCPRNHSHGNVESGEMPLVDDQDSVFYVGHCPSVNFDVASKMQQRARACILHPAELR